MISVHNVFVSYTHFLVPLFLRTLSDPFSTHTQERRNQFLATQGGDALSQLQATLSASASFTPRYSTSPRNSTSGASGRFTPPGYMSPPSGYLSPTYSTAAASPRALGAAPSGLPPSGYLSPTYSSAGASPRALGAAPSGLRSGSGSPRTQASTSPVGYPFKFLVLYALLD